MIQVMCKYRYKKIGLIYYLSFFIAKLYIGDNYARCREIKKFYR